MLISVFTVTMIAFFVLTVWSEAPVEHVRRPREPAADAAAEREEIEEAA